jgi:hypothetical protein
MDHTSDRPPLPVRPLCLLSCDPCELAVVLLLARPCTVGDAHSVLDVLSVALLARTLLELCQPSADKRDSDAHGQYHASASTSPAQESSELVALRTKLAVTAGVTVADDAPHGECLLRAVQSRCIHFSRVASLLLDAFGPSSASDHYAQPIEVYTPLNVSAVVQHGGWSERLKTWACALVGAGRDPATCALQQPRCLHVERMPPDFASLTVQLHRRVCLACNKPPTEPAVCLLCGALLCAGPTCRRERVAGEPKEGECTRHARICGLGVGIFALVHQCTTLLVDETRSAYYGSLYLDAHNEEDRGLRRGKPLYLSEARQAAIRRLWLTQTVPLEVARSRSSTSQVIRLAYY